MKLSKLEKTIKEAKLLGIDCWEVWANGRFIGLGRRERDLWGQPHEFLTRGTQKEIIKGLEEAIDEIKQQREIERIIHRKRSQRYMERSI